MRNFILGIIVVVVIGVVIGLGVAEFGLMPTNADATPSGMETKIASHALDASMDRNAPRVTNPVAVTDDNLIDGVKIYSMNCAVCHGDMDYKPSALEHSLYPPPPQLVLRPLDDPEWHINYAIRTGIRYTGMPSWQKALSAEDIWKVTAFLSRVDHLPPAVQDYCKKAYGVAPQSQPSEAHDHMGH